MCRAHAIGWDVRSKIGTLFTLLDTVKRENIGMIYCGHNLRDAIYNFARGLHVIHQEISAPNMQGLSFFNDFYIKSFTQVPQISTTLFMTLKKFLK